MESDLSLLRERHSLCTERIREIAGESLPSMPEAYNRFFGHAASFLLMLEDTWQMLASGQYGDLDMDTLAEKNKALYVDILPENYENSFACPDFACRELRKPIGQILCFLMCELRGCIAYVFDGREEAFVVHLELFLQIYTCFAGDDFPQEQELRDILYWFESDYCDLFVAGRVLSGIDPSDNLALRVILDSDLQDLRYVYRYGEYVTDDEIRVARFLGGADESLICKIADTFTEGYRMGFVHAKKDLSKKRTVSILYHVGFERVVRKAIENFRKMGLKPVIYRSASCVVNRRGTSKAGYTGANPNPQFDYDHREDLALILDARFVKRRLDMIQSTYEHNRELAAGYAGPAVMEVFGEKPFSPAVCADALTFNEKQREQLVRMYNDAARITNTFIIGKERSFTIIDFPLPSIGDRFEEIFADTIRINTLDNKQYETIQQVIIDALDQGNCVHIKGRDQNRTNLYVALHPLQDPTRETIFENCVADVNVPVGEVFTSPRLEGTNGVLHVTGVFLNGLFYENLSLTFTEGMISAYSCTNFEEPAENEAYVRANVLYHHDTLPMGECAIGTNTTAYVTGRKYHIEDRMPILIAEKCGPHFAVGDTCYRFEEDNPVYNPDGKEIIARDNSISQKRREDPDQAYFGCHTDITIPYEELGLLEVTGENGYRQAIIRDGRFVLPGTEALNEALDTETNE
ncbi:MAG: aminopeptidase [Lachnospiraceae bacterium]|nr:aminopeptidase [Lachnospiraceae bacterium]